jgi:hypothetical protein
VVVRIGVCAENLPYQRKNLKKTLKMLRLPTHSWTSIPRKRMPAVRDRSKALTTIVIFLISLSSWLSLPIDSPKNFCIFLKAEREAERQKDRNRQKKTERQKQKIKIYGFENKLFTYPFIYTIPYSSKPEGVYHYLFLMELRSRRLIPPIIRSDTTKTEEQTSSVGPARPSPGAQQGTSPPSCGPSLLNRLFGLDYRSLATFRILLAILHACDFFHRLLSFHEHYTDEGCLPRSNAIPEVLFTF